MKIMYIESKLKNLKLDLSNSEINKLPKKLILVYTIQYKEVAESVKKQLEKNKIKISQFQQVLGCSKLNNKLNLPILIIGTGQFHSLNLYTQTSSIFTLDGSKIHQIPAEEIERIKQKKKASLAKFLNAENIGILVSTKPGQENLEKAIKLKKSLEKNKKQVYIFISDNIDITQFENFNIDSWVNTACEGLSMDNSDVINYSEVLSYI